MHYRMFSDLEKYYYQIWQKLESYREETGLELISGNIRRGIAEGLFVDTYNIEVLSAMRLNQLDTIHRRADQLHLQTTLPQTTEHYLRGLATEKGRQEINKFLLTSTITTDNQK